MFDLPLLQFSSHLRGGFDAAGAFTGGGQWVAESRGYRRVNFRSSCARRPGKASALVACYIGAAYWFTASTSFANPAAVMGRMMSDSFCWHRTRERAGVCAGAMCGGGCRHHRYGLAGTNG